ncbi:conserved exported hypothetical protein [Bosea sp. 62]|nr:conserved exported hypothetical protein [Bosea sp. 21B]CAD5289003.1 conserved exported hypothetical protein [Bosea sp. 46]CAD5301274.1 conserved exported hypothetical protein [Bosea sp. 7B]VVT60565.1 conserved exported hypothetical protein [Bosea sp. EC-HK365B]VXB05027.1 conserved exported hypothetical protein [Bosea sp. 62]VXB66532.1 conserved exported hypothetical protein [Bosea sp. 127]VXC60205.1 conserved exported hypothetical protein [Bosea sp. 29B]VXC92512.1 conserved exported hypot
MMRIARLLAFALCLAALPAVAQDKPAAAPPPEPMRIVLTRSAEPCEPDCREWLAAQGAIGKDTLAELRRALAELNGRKLPLLVYSTGGTVETAIAMGELVRKSGLDIAVARTVFSQRDPALGTIDERSPLCASACTLLLAGGQRRIIPPQSRIGVHQQTIVETETTTVRDYKIVRGRKELVDERTETRTVKQEQATGEIDAKMRRYLEAMGLDRSFLEVTVSTPADTMRYLKPDEMQATTIATEVGPASLAFSTSRSLRGSTGPANLGAAPVLPATLVAPATPIGSVELGPHRGSILRLALSVGEGRYQQTAALQFQLFIGQAALPTRLRTVTITLPGSPLIVASNEDGSAPEGPMTAEIQREFICRLTDRSAVFLRVDPPAEDSSPASWQRTGTAAEVLRLPNLRATLCR